MSENLNYPKVKTSATRSREGLLCLLGSVDFHFFGYFIIIKYQQKPYKFCGFYRVLSL